jgi:hypothetical protein
MLQAWNNLLLYNNISLKNARESIRGMTCWLQKGLLPPGGSLQTKKCPSPFPLQKEPRALRKNVRLLLYFRLFSQQRLKFAFHIRILIFLHAGAGGDYPSHDHIFFQSPQLID